MEVLGMEKFGQVQDIMVCWTHSLNVGGKMVKCWVSESTRSRHYILFMILGPEFKGVSHINPLMLSASLHLYFFILSSNNKFALFLFP